MRFCGGFLCREQVYCPKKGHKTHSAARESVHSALLAIDHADCDSTLQTGLAEPRESLHRGASRSDDVLDEADALTRFVDAFEPVRGPLLLRGLADDQEGQARGQRGSRRERHRTELGAGEPNRVRLVLGDGCCDVLAERREQVWPGLEPVLVEVVARAPARAKDEVTLDVCMLPDCRS